jgi:hypothetical protein
LKGSVPALAMRMTPGFHPATGLLPVQNTKELVRSKNNSKKRAADSCKENLLQRFWGFGTICFK